MRRERSRKRVSELRWSVITGVSNPLSADLGSPRSPLRFGKWSSQRSTIERSAESCVSWLRTHQSTGQICGLFRRRSKFITVEIGHRTHYTRSVRSPEGDILEQPWSRSWDGLASWVRCFWHLRPSYLVGNIHTFQGLITDLCRNSFDWYIFGLLAISSLTSQQLGENRTRSQCHLQLHAGEEEDLGGGSLVLEEVLQAPHTLHEFEGQNAVHTLQAGLRGLRKGTVRGRCGKPEELGLRCTSSNKVRGISGKIKAPIEWGTLQRSECATINSLHWTVR